MAGTVAVGVPQPTFPKKCCEQLVTAGHRLVEFAGSFHALMEIRIAMVSFRCGRLDSHWGHQAVLEYRLARNRRVYEWC
jgi:hypothetical protein